MSTFLPKYALTAGDPGEDVGGVFQAHLEQNLGPLCPLLLGQAVVLDDRVSLAGVEVGHVNDLLLSALVSE